MKRCPLGLEPAPYGTCRHRLESDGLLDLSCGWWAVHGMSEDGSEAPPVSAWDRALVGMRNQAEAMKR